MEKNFMWRACHDLLPTCVNLYKRKIINDPMHPLCGLVEETTTHVLWLCSAAFDVWSMGDRRLQKSKAHGEDFLQIVEGIFASYDEKEIQLFVGLAQKIWMRRNDVVHGNPFTHPTELMVRARRDLDNYRRVIDGDDTHMLVSTATPVQTWKEGTYS
jgi:hypothetical protein